MHAHHIDSWAGSFVSWSATTLVYDSNYRCCCFAVSGASCFQGFFRFADMQPLLRHFCVYHVNAPGQEEDSPALSQQYAFSYQCFMLHEIRNQRPSIKYVILFLANFYPPPPVTLFHTSRDPQKYVTHLVPPRFFSRPSTKNPDKIPMHKFSLNCSRGFCPGGFVRGSLVWKVLSGLVFVHSSFCHNTSVTTES